ncbi:hypothetical protein T10_8886 [Trichinella papuae]|uniref:Uncharacterized protein n=1 Tax=Trichinella papuae TaxID=268474 RepID=A0A0V1MTB4_9BILA|nr:hypothetical protein T10_8886 [Trichinella papuae]
MQRTSWPPLILPPCILFNSLTTACRRPAPTTYPSGCGLHYNESKIAYLVDLRESKNNNHSKINFNSTWYKPRKQHDDNTKH